MKKKKTRCILLIAIIIAANQVSKVKAGFIKNLKADQAKDNIDHLFHARKNVLYTRK